MSVLLGSASINELGQLEGGKLGDQNGKEVLIQNWYLHNKGWVVIRATSPEVRKKIAKNMRNICKNDNIGYSYWDNCYGLLNEASKYKYDASKVKIKCDTNCAKSVICCIRYAGINVEDFNTGNEVSMCEKTGKFVVLTTAKYCKSSDYLLEGDILVTKTKGHTVVVLTDGAKAKEYIPGKLVNCVYCNLRVGPSINYAKVTTLDGGTNLKILDYGKNGWGLVDVLGVTGYVSPLYLEEYKTAKVTGGSTWLRDKPGKDVGAKIVSLSSGTIVYISGETSMVGKTPWYKVFYKGNEGWASGLYVKPIK